MGRRASIVAAVLSAACFGTLAVLTKLAYEGGAQPLQILVWRFGLATLVLGGYIAARRPASLLVPAGDLAKYAMLSVAGYGAASICFFFALKTVSASVAAILLYTYPAMVAAAEALLGGWRLTVSRLGAVGLAFTGCVLVVDPFGGASRIEWPGVALGLGAAAGYAGFSVMSARLLPGRSRLVLMIYMLAFTGVMAALAAAVSGSRLVPTGWSLSVWAVLAAIVVVPTFAAIVLYLSAIRRLGAAQAALLSTTEPLFTIAFAVVLLGEDLGAVQWIGAALVMGGVVIAERYARRAGELAPT
jgi:drug/metabolite transporter (DMT)-like permease